MLKQQKTFNYFAYFKLNGNCCQPRKKRYKKGYMIGNRTTTDQDRTMTDAEGNGIICDLLAIIKQLDDRLDQAIKRLEQHEIDSDDI